MTLNRSRKELWLGGSLVGAVTVVLLVLFFSPIPQAHDFHPSESAGLRLSSTEQAPRDGGSSIPPPELARLFGLGTHRSPTSARTLDVPPPPAANDDKSAAPLRYVGWAAEESGPRRYLFTDVVTGRVVDLSLRRPCGKWKLLATSEEAFVLSDGERSYVLPRDARVGGQSAR